MVGTFRCQFYKSFVTHFVRLINTLDCNQKIVCLRSISYRFYKIFLLNYICESIWQEIEYVQNHNDGHGHSCKWNVQCTWCSVENPQSPVYVVNWHFSWCPDRCLNCYCNLALLTHICHIWELSNEVMYDPVPKGVQKIWQVKAETSKF